MAALAEEPDIELLLLDINMPVMDGLTMLGELRQRQSPVRAIVVSGYGDMANTRTPMNRGAYDFVTKPIDLNDLEITIHKTLDELARLRDLDLRRAAAERARVNLSRYFAPTIAHMLADRDDPLGAVRRQNVAVLFVDIVGFTRMAERMEPEAVVDLLRQFHERMTAKIFACGGTVEKYIGDEIFAVFGLPTAIAEDATNALRCADLMLGALEEWNRERNSRAEPPLGIGIGLNYGPAVIGDVGSEHSFSFTVIGDTVDTASRLQGLTRTLQTPLVIAEAVVSASMPHRPAARRTLLARLQAGGEQTVRGRSSMVRVWTQGAAALIVHLRLPRCRNPSRSGQRAHPPRSGVGATSPSTRTSFMTANGPKPASFNSLRSPGRRRNGARDR